MKLAKFALFALAVFAFAPVAKAENLPPGARPVPTVEFTLADHERRIAALEAAATGGNVATPRVAPAVARAPSGHTHTCANGHTWDHATNPTHNCQECGLPQYVQDSSPRMVTAGYKSLGVSSGGCGAGGCSAGVSAGSDGWYLGKNVGRRR